MLAGVVDCAVVVVGFRLGEPSGGQPVLPAIPSRSCSHEAVREAPVVRGREAIQFVDRTGGWVMALPGLHEVLVMVMPRPSW